MILEDEDTLTEQRNIEFLFWTLRLATGKHYTIENIAFWLLYAQLNIPLNWSYAMAFMDCNTYNNMIATIYWSDEADFAVLVVSLTVFYGLMIAISAKCMFLTIDFKTTIALEMVFSLVNFSIGLVLITSFIIEEQGITMCRRNKGFTSSFVWISPCLMFLYAIYRLFLAWLCFIKLANLAMTDKKLPFRRGLPFIESSF